MSNTIAVPGGSATFYDVNELTPRRRRPLEVLFVQMGDLQERIQAAATVTVTDPADGSAATTAPLEPAVAGKTSLAVPIVLDAREAGLMVEVGQVAAWAFLKSWTLPEPVPATPDDMLDISSTALYDAVVGHGAKLYSGNVGDGFDLGPETVTDPASPTVA